MRERVNVLHNGKQVTGTKVTRHGKTFLILGNPQKVKGLEKSLAKFEEFNFSPARRMRRQEIPLDVPFIKIGKVPVVTYMSKKEGTMKAYRHETKKMPTLWAHPTKPVFVMLGGSIKVRDWLYD